MAHVTVVQPYLPHYRVPLFERLAGDLAERGIGLTVAHGHPTGAMAGRGDSSRLPGSVQLDQRVFRVAGRELMWRRISELAYRSDVLVCEQALRNLEPYRWLARRGGPAVAFFGHGRTYTRKAGSLARTAKSLVTRRADWFFAYTEQGARYIARRGFPADRITVVNNAIDTTSLATAVDAVTEEELAAFRRTHGLTSGRTALYVGGLDRAKRIPFLLAAATYTARRLPGFRLLVAGDGEERGRVRAVEAAQGCVVYLGRLSGQAKALAGAASDVLMLPGLVGLAAVDSFALRTPLVTSPDAHHAPEFGYLMHGRNALIVPGDAAAYGESVAGLLLRPGRLAALREACRQDAGRYTVEGMSDRFTQGLERLIDSRRIRVGACTRS
jgi:glycosyltransferase involved in cell wall biosynthesis